MSTHLIQTVNDHFSLVAGDRYGTSGQRKGSKRVCSFCLYCCAKENWDHRGCCCLGFIRGVQSIPSGMSPHWCQRSTAQASHAFCSGTLRLGNLRCWNFTSLEDREMLLRANDTGIIFGFPVIVRKNPQHFFSAADKKLWQVFSFYQNDKNAHKTANCALSSWIFIFFPVFQ